MASAALLPSGWHAGRRLHRPSLRCWLDRSILLVKSSTSGIAGGNVRRRAAAASVLVVAADPEVGVAALVASLGRAVEQRIEAHHDLDAARVGRIGVVDHALLEREGAQGLTLAEVSRRVGPALGSQLIDDRRGAGLQHWRDLLLGSRDAEVEVEVALM